MQNLLQHVQHFGRCRIAVIGDLMLDEYLWGHIERISPEAPVPILNVERREATLGGAGNVVENLRVLGVHVSAFGVVGRDQTGEKLQELLASHGADAYGVVPDPSRKSTRKSRMMSLEHGQQVFRLDEESAVVLNEAVEESLIDRIRDGLSSVHLILFSDYLKGVLTARLLQQVFVSARQRGIPCIVAPKDTNAEKYRGATLLIPNARELAQLMGTTGNGSDWLNPSAVGLINKLNLEALVVTRSKEGMSLFERRQGALCRVDVPTTARSVYDVTGAGDTAVAVLGACIASGTGLEPAVQLANMAAGIKVGKRGTACVSAKELTDSIAQNAADSQGARPHVRVEVLTPAVSSDAQSVATLRGIS